MAKKVKCGFTLVEVALFLAVTGMLFAGIVAGVQGSMFQQRYNDSVQSFAEFLRSIYSQVSNVQNIDGRGNSADLAIYGKLVTFGEEKNFEDKNNFNEKIGGKVLNYNAIFSYTVVGNINNKVDDEDLGTCDEVDIATLKDLCYRNIDVIKKKKNDTSSADYELAGIAEEYFPRWGAGIQTDDGWEKASGFRGYKPFVGALLIVRDARSGTISTYVMSSDDTTDDATVQVNDKLKKLSGSGDKNILTDELKNFKSKRVDFCVDPEGNTRDVVRRDIRLMAGARNASAIEIMEQDSDENKCEGWRRP